MLEFELLLLVVLLLLSAFFSGVETALISLNMIKVKALLKQKRKNAETLYRIKQNPHRLTITILIGNNLVNVTAAAFTTAVFTDLFGSKGIGIATGVITLLILLFGEITPKSYAIQNATKVSLMVAPIIELLQKILSPIVKSLEYISLKLTRIMGVKKEKRLSEEELSTIVTMGVKEGILDREAGEMIHNLLEFEDTHVKEIMTLKDDMQMIDGRQKLRKILNFIIKSPYSKFPVYTDKQDNITGILHIDDVLRYLRNKRLDTYIKSMTRPVHYVPESKQIDDLLTEFEGKHVPMAIVVDEYGKVSGLVTVEDILEEIVGDIFDKSKRKHIYIKKVNEKLIRVDGRATIEQVNKFLHLGLKAKHFDTIAGFVEHSLQKIPKRGERIYLKNTIIEVSQVTKQGIKKVKIIKT